MLSSARTQALCMLLIVTIAHSGAASAAGHSSSSNNSNNKSNILPGSCLMAASTLCANADTNAMRCLRKLAIAGDARVPIGCSEALMTGVKMNPRLKQATRMSRLLGETIGPVPNCGANSCPSDFGSVSNNQCNDVQTGCGGCSKGTYTAAAGSGAIAVVSLSTPNPNGINCANICCKAAVVGAVACCQSYSFGPYTSVYCRSSANNQCNAPYN